MGIRFDWNPLVSVVSVWYALELMPGLRQIFLCNIHTSCQVKWIKINLNGKELMVGRKCLPRILVFLCHMWFICSYGKEARIYSRLCVRGRVTRAGGVLKF